MPRIVPSQALAVIARLYPQIDKPGPQSFTISWNAVANVGAILALAEAIPSELLTVDDKAFTDFVEAKAMMAVFIENSHAHGSSSVPLKGEYIKKLRDVLAQCPDQAVPAAVDQLTFISDTSLRDALRRDIAEVEKALIEAEWKSATVMSGSVVEALLLWALDQQRVAADKAGASLGKPATGSLEEWVLHQYIEVALALGLIEKDTATQCRLAKDFRNLIHPGRAVRLAQTCDRGTARAAAAAVDLVIRDLTP